MQEVGADALQAWQVVLMGGWRVPASSCGVHAGVCMRAHGDTGGSTDDTGMTALA